MLPNLADVAMFLLLCGHLFEEALMRDSMKSRDASRLFIPEPDSTEGDARVCRKCGSDLTLHQPDPEMPERILGTCDECKTWCLFDGDLERVEIAPRRTSQGEVCIPNPSPVSSNVIRLRNASA